MLVGRISPIRFMAEQSRIQLKNFEQNSINIEQLKQLIDANDSMHIEREPCNPNHPDFDIFRIIVTRPVVVLNTEVSSKSIFQMPPNSTSQDILSKITNSLVKKVMPLLKTKYDWVDSAMKKLSSSNTIPGSGKFSYKIPKGKI